MKIEKISDNQIKCTLTRSDLASHQLRISEIAYGTEKANSLFRDMMDKASLELGFDCNDLPMSIEAIPVSMDCIILMITMLDEPAEADPEIPGLAVLKDLFSRDFSDELPFGDSFPGDFSPETLLQQAIRPVRDPAGAGKTEKDLLLSFDRMETVMQFAREIAGCSLTCSALYKSEDGSRYFLYLLLPPAGTADYAYISTLSLEFGRQEVTSASRIACLKEHCEQLLDGNAVQKLASV